MEWMYEYEYIIFMKQLVPQEKNYPKPIQPQNTENFWNKNIL